MCQHLEDLPKSVNQYFSSDQYLMLQNHAWLNDPVTVQKRPMQRMQCVNVTEKEKFTPIVSDSTWQLTLKQRPIKGHKTLLSVLTISPCEVEFSSAKQLMTDGRQKQMGESSHLLLSLIFKRSTKIQKNATLLTKLFLVLKNIVIFLSNMLFVLTCNGFVGVF